MSDSELIQIYTDGACRGNPGNGGWGVLIEYESISKEYFGGCLLYTSDAADE